MLGLINHNRSWRWKASGKHPAASDYIDVLSGTPLMDAVAEWMAKGYIELQRKQLTPLGIYSWRFWLRGIKKGTLICGLSRDSSDRIGRPFPLLIVGEGPVKDWEEHWVSLPAVLSKTWARIERTAAKRHDDLHAFSEEIGQLGSPEHDGAHCEAISGEPAGSISEDRLNACRSQLDRTGRTVIALDDAESGAYPAETAIRWHTRLSTLCGEIPRAVFWGGTAQHAFLVVIRQPLATDDFVTLWSL